MMFDLSVVIPTICRDSLIRAVRSVFSQTFEGSIQILIGVDHDPQGAAARCRAQLEAECPANRTITWVSPGYSTSQRHGGVHSCQFGGSLRSALTFLAGAEIVVYLDDDDWLAPEHCQAVLVAIEDKCWAYSYSIYADGNLGKGLCLDELESVGVNKGIYRAAGGFVRPSGLAINKLRVLSLIHLWSCALSPRGDGEDRLVFKQLSYLPHGFTGKASVYYALDPRDVMHDRRMAYLRSQRVAFVSDEKDGSVR